MKYFFFYLMICLPIQLEAQQTAYEKTLAHLKTHRDRVGSKDPTLLPLYQALAKQAVNSKRYKSAQASYFAILELQELHFPNQSTALATTYQDLGSLYSLMEEPEYALRCYIKALNLYSSTHNKLDSNRLILYRQLTDAYTQNQQVKKALYTALQAWQMMQLEADEWTNAIATQRVAVNICYQSLALYYEQQRSVKEALATYQAALSFDPSFEPALYHSKIGQLYLNIKDYKAAKTAFDSYETIIGDEATVHYHWALYFFSKKQKKQALNHLKQALEAGFTNWEMTLLWEEEITFLEWAKEAQEKMADY